MSAQNDVDDDNENNSTQKKTRCLEIDSNNTGWEKGFSFEKCASISIMHLYIQNECKA